MAISQADAALTYTSPARLMSARARGPSRASSASHQIRASVSSSRRFTASALERVDEAGRQRRVEVADNLPFPGPASGHAARPVGERDETRARFSVARDDDFFALRGPLDELGESRLGGGDVDRFPHEVST